MKYKNKISTLILLIAVAVFGFACQTQQAGQGNNANTAAAKPAVKAQTPTEAYRMLYAACKAKDRDTIRQLMSKGSLGLAGMSAGQQKKTLDQVLENGLVAPTLAPSITEIRDERVIDNFGRVEVYNEKEKRWEDLPFVLEDGGWKLAVGDLFAGTFDPQNILPKGTAQSETEASNKMMPMPSNSNGAAKFPGMSGGGNKSVKAPAADETKSVEVPKEDKPKQ